MITGEGIPSASQANVSRPPSSTVWSTGVRVNATGSKVEVTVNSAAAVFVPYSLVAVHV